eukprot:TRINITY_DN3068_c10_g2_i1.p1 TRINITY_DN3068_c10_g2~~TRINITY_DN3068_c10_g2_i1.p1  ORF type:complete len:403 (-),score=84.49 TRINITY_DN3068_c10_g2_i1:445-1653(-)
MNKTNNTNKEIICEMLPLLIDNESMKIWDVEVSGSMYDCGFSLNDKYFVFGSSEADVYFFDGKSWDLKRHLRHHKDHISGVLDVAFSRNGEMVATCSGGSTIIVSNLRDFSVKRLKNNTSTFGICFSHCSNYFYSGDTNGNLKKWNLNTRRTVCMTRLHSYFYRKIILSPDGKLLLTINTDHAVRLIDPDNLSVIHMFSHDYEVTAIDFHPNQKMIAVADQSNKVKLWNWQMDSTSLLHSFDIGGQAYSLIFLNSTILIIMSSDGYISLFNVFTFEEIQKIYCGCDGLSKGLAVSSDKLQLLCENFNDNTIRIYPLVGNCHPSQYPKLVELSKDDGYVLSNLIDMNIDTQTIRQLVAAGVYMNEGEFKMIVDTCWDLVDINEANGGNMGGFMISQCDSSEDD